MKSGPEAPVQKDSNPTFNLGDSSIFNASHYNLTGSPLHSSFSRKDFYKIWLVYNKCELHFADRSVYIDQPALIFSNPLIPYAYEGLANERSGYWCIFKEEFLMSKERSNFLQETPLFRIGGDHIFLLDDPQLAKAEHLFDQIISELSSDYHYKYDEIRNYVNLLIHQGMKMRPAATRKQQGGSARITSLFLELLERQFPIQTPQEPMQLKKPGDFAFNLSVHVNHLNFSVKEITGKPTSVHIADRMVNEAKALLKHTDWNIADIAYGLGFDYSSHFNNFFKKHTSITPLSFRK